MNDESESYSVLGPTLKDQSLKHARPTHNLGQKRINLFLSFSVYNVDMFVECTVSGPAELFPSLLKIL